MLIWRRRRQLETDVVCVFLPRLCADRCTVPSPLYAPLPEITIVISRVLDDLATGSIAAARPDSCQNLDVSGRSVGMLVGSVRREIPDVNFHSKVPIPTGIWTPMQCAYNILPPKRHLDWFNRFCTVHGSAVVPNSTHKHSLYASCYICSNRSHLYTACRRPGPIITRSI